MPSKTCQRVFLQIRIFIAFLLFPVLRIFAAAVLIQSIFPRLVDTTVLLFHDHLRIAAGLRADWNDALAVPYLIRISLVFELSFTILLSVISFVQGTRLITKDVEWNRLMEDYMDGFMFSSCANLALNILLMMNIDERRLPHIAFLSIIISLSVAMEIAATWFSNVLIDTFICSYYIIELNDIPFKFDEIDENNNSADEFESNLENIVCDLQVQVKGGAEEGVPI